MNKAELLAALDECREFDTEEGHMKADRLLLDFIGDAEVTAAFEALSKWYA